MRKSTARVLIVLSAVLWGTSFPIIRYGLQFMTPIVFLFWRFLVATLLLGQILWKMKININLRLLGGFVGLAGFLNALAYLLQFVGQKLTYATNAALMINTSPIFTAIFAHFLLGEKLNKTKISGILITLIGAATIIAGSANIRFRVIGDIICLMAGAIWGLYITLAKKLKEQNYNDFELLFIWFLQVTILGGMLLPTEKNILAIDIAPISVILYTSVFCTILPFYLWYRALETLEASTSSNYFMIEILVSALLEVTLLQLKLTMHLILGAILIIIGVYITDISANESKSLTTKAILSN